MLNRNCRSCGGVFQIFDEDLKFYEKVSPIFNGKKYFITPPTFCPDCRQMRRLTYRNERNFYKRNCDLTGENIISVYTPAFPGKVFSHEAFYGDKWHATDYGRDFDFSRGFFEQFLELSLDAPRLCTVNMSSENSTYTNHSAYNKNCYMCINTGYSEDLLYCTNYSLKNKDCVDCLAIFYCERCYFCVSVTNAQFCSFLYVSFNLDNCHFCFDCRHCSNCFGCNNLRQKKYCIFNKQYSKEEYEKRIEELMPKTWEQYIEMFEKWKISIKKEAVHKCLYQEQCIDSSGDYLDNCKNVRDSFYTFGSQDCRYCYDAGKLKDCYDTTEPFNEELHYELQASFGGYHNIFSIKNLEAKNTVYCQYCIRSQDCLGCFGMNGGQYRIFNKQYTKKEYENLVPKIIEHMKKTTQGGAGPEWGEFFPIEHSPYFYNDTVANDYFPMTKEEVLKKNWKWKDQENYDSLEGFTPPENIDEVSEDICEKTLKCEVSGRPYRITHAELKFYKKMGLPIPRRHFDERFKMRMELRNPRKMRETACSKCGDNITTTCPEDIKNIYCEKCYLKEVY